jgi:YVTN family beta-propeller protein
VSSDGKLIYVAVSNLHGFNVVDVKNKKVLTRFVMAPEHPGPPRPRAFETPDTYTHGLALSPAGDELWVTSLLDDCIYIYEVHSGKITGRVNVGDGPNWVVFSPNGKLVCVSNTGSDDVSIIDAAARREVTRIKVGKAPKRLAVGPS